MKNTIRFVFFLFTTLLIFSKVQAQSESPQQCGYDYFLDKVANENPEYKNIIDRTFDRAKRPISGLRKEILTIPVVVHIVYQNEFQNLSEERVLKVIKRINEDFSHTNANADDLRPEFLDIVGDAMIQFDLKEIKRVPTNKIFKFNLLFGTFPDIVKETSKGGSDASDVETHLNIWVCNIDGGALLGYAYPPACAPNWPDGSTPPEPKFDGVVIHYKTFDVGTSYVQQGVSLKVEGRTVTHEIGHYLGLRHIWGDGLSTVLGIPDCTVDDGVDDTPNQGLSSQNQCDFNQNTCTDDSDDLKDMIENYMDYTRETCTSAFTNGQIAVMRGVLNDCRKSLIDSTYTSGVDSNKQEELIVFPNPNNGLFTILLPKLEIEHPVFEFYNASGKYIYPPVIELDGLFQIDMSNQASAVYFVRMRDAKKTYTKKIVITRY